MKKLFVIGERSSKSLSPLIFNHWFNKYKIKAHYDFVEITNKKFEKEILKILKLKDVVGLNITIPYKKKIIKHVDVSDSHTKNIGAANCIVFKKEKTKGVNTDWLGYKRSLGGLKLKKNDKIIILGYGGAAKAIYYYFIKSGFNNVLVFNRTKKKLHNKKKKIFTKNYIHLDKELDCAKIIINTIPTNILKPKHIRQIRETTIVNDIVYSPKNTNFLKSFKKNKKIYGISMLLEQAIPSFKHWFGFEPTVDNKLLTKINKKIK